MPKLVVISDILKDQTFELTEERVTVGRVPDNQVQIEDGAVSSHHAELTRKGEDYAVRDLNSTNGTRVNGQRIIEQRLYHGDTVSFGQLHMQYISSAKKAPQPLPSPKSKMVDLSSSQTDIMKRPTSFRSSSPFVKTNRSKAGMIFRVVFLFLGLVAIALLVFAILKILTKQG